MAFLPVIDKATLPRHPIDALAGADIDLVIGWTSDEASFAFGMHPQCAATTRDQVIAGAGTRFARDGDRNREGAPSWRAYTAEDRAVLVVGDDNIRIETDKVKALSASA